MLSSTEYSLAAERVPDAINEGLWLVSPSPWSRQPERGGISTLTLQIGWKEADYVYKGAFVEIEGPGNVIRAIADCTRQIQAVKGRKITLRGLSQEGILTLPKKIEVGDTFLVQFGQWALHCKVHAAVRAPSAEKLYGEIRYKRTNYPTTPAAKGEIQRDKLQYWSSP